MKQSSIALSLLIIILGVTCVIFLIIPPVEITFAQANCGVNRCETYKDLQGVWNYNLYCSKRFTQGCGLDDRFGAERIPIECGSGSSIVAHVTCNPSGKTANWAYSCASTGDIKFKVVSRDDCSSTGGGGGGGGGLACSVPTGEPPPYNCDPPDISCDPSTGHWSTRWCMCVCNSSPILIDTSGNGFDLTDPQHGVEFDLNSNGVAEPMA